MKKEVVFAEKENSTQMQEAVLPVFEENDYIIDEVLKEHVSERVADKIKADFVKYFWIEGKVKFIQTFKDSVKIQVEGFYQSPTLPIPPPSRVFSIPPNDEVFLTEFKRAQDFDLVVKVCYSKLITTPPYIKSVTVLR